MYLEKIYYKNVGPINEIDYTFKKDEQGNPIPLIIVGKNGSGKSILLSHIVDAFYELAAQEYNNVILHDVYNNLSYYKPILSNQIKINEPYLISYLNFKYKETNLEYIFKSGELSFDKYKELRNSDWNNTWNNETFYKNTTKNKQIIKECFSNNVICFFGPNRYMKPSWLGEPYYHQDKVDYYSTQQRFNNHLYNPIVANNITELTLQWLFDIITDSRIDTVTNIINTPTVELFTKRINLLLTARRNAEEIMSKIIEEDILFKMQTRGYSNLRFQLIRKNDHKLLVSSLDALSTGQLSLFHLFATIIRYADNNSINFSYTLDQIQGIVVIDEIELHLHTHLQAVILPNLIKLFPKIQFIITSHSPLFLLGMKENFDNIEILEMPTGRNIMVEEFADFKDAYQAIQHTEKYNNDIKEIIEANSEKNLIITEGSTD